MNRKNFIFVAMLFAALSLGFVSCDDKGNEPDDPQGEETQTPDPDEGEEGGDEGGSSSSTSGSENVYEWVDLGLSVNWATCNVGATKPEEYGNYYAWGETTPKTTYDWSTYKWCNGSYDTMTKYCTNSDYGTVDNYTVLGKEDDAASVNMGGSWRMPTYKEQAELQTKCTWTWTTLNGVNGYNVEGPNGNSIFLPAAGCRDYSDLYRAGSYGYYWSRSLNQLNSGYALYLYFHSGDVDWTHYNSRCCGRSVRGVTIPKLH